MGQVVPILHARERQERRASEPSDGQLVAAVVGGSASARETLFRRHYPGVLKLAHRLLGREDDAEDLAQDVCLIAFRTLSKLRDADTFAGWIRRICVLRARSRIRHYAMLRKLLLVPSRIVDPDQVVSSSAPPEVATELRLLYGHLRRLPADVQVALVLRRVEGRSIDEIAELMQRSPATVKRRLAEGHSFLQRLDGRSA